MALLQSICDLQWRHCFHHKDWFQIQGSLPDNLGVFLWVWFKCVQSNLILPCATIKWHSISSTFIAMTNYGIQQKLSASHLATGEREKKSLLTGSRTDLHTWKTRFLLLSVSPILCGVYLDFHHHLPAAGTQNDHRPHPGVQQVRKTVCKMHVEMSSGYVGLSVWRIMGLG